jgi:hypothetical protein
MTTLAQLTKEVELIKKRNQQVELDKRWETSGFRKILLIVFTYITIGVYISSIGVSNPWVNAIVPAIGFFLSTLTLPFFRSFWEKYRVNR